MLRRTWRKGVDQFFKWLGILSLFVFGGLFVLTILAPIPSFRYWIAGSALFQAAAFLFASVIGVLGLKPNRRQFWGLIVVAILLAGFAWSQAAEQAQQTENNQQLMEALNKRGLGNVNVVGQLKSDVWPNGEWLTRRRIHITGSSAQTGMVLRFYGPDVKAFVVARMTEQKSDDEPYEDNHGAYAHYIRQPIGIYDVVIKFAHKGPVQFTYEFEDGRGESAKAKWD